MFDFLVILFAIVFYWISISFTIVARYILLGVFTLIILAHALGLTKPKASRRESLQWLFNVCLFGSGKSLAYTVLSLSLMPILISLLHQEFFGTSFELNWYNPHNSWIIIVVFAFANYFIALSQKNKTSWLHKEALNLATLSLFFSLLVESLYSIYSVSYGSNEYHGRWQGSSGNPQVWAAQIAIYLLVWLSSHKSITKFTGSNWLSYSVLALIGINSLASASISHFVGMGLASLTFFMNPLSSLVLASLIVAAIHGLALVLIHNSDTHLLANQLGGLSKKILPRMKLWIDLEASISQFQIDPFIGAGYSAYSKFLAGITKHHHVHNLYLHFWMTGGLLGLYNLAAFLIHQITQLGANNNKSKYILACVLYIMGSGCFECGTIYPEVLQMFWLCLPLVKKTSLLLTSFNHMQIAEQ